MVFRLLLPAVLVASLVRAAGAGELPRYPVDEDCAHFAAFEAAGAVQNREPIRKACVLDQQEAYDRLKSDWPAVGETDQARCLRMTSEAPNYRSLGRCVARLLDRRDAERRLQGPQSFRY